MKQDLKERFMGHVEMIPEAGCWLWTASVSVWGYGFFSAEGRNRSAHRVAYEMFNGPIPEDKVVMHACDVRSCVNPAHLVLGTHADNSQDASRKGRLASGKRHWKVANPEKGARGESHHRTKLTEEQAFFVRHSEISLVKLSARYDVSVSQLSRIRNNESWNCLPNFVNFSTERAQNLPAS